MKRFAILVALGALGACAASPPPSAGIAAADAGGATPAPRYDAVTTRDFGPTGPGNWFERNQGVAPAAAAP